MGTPSHHEPLQSPAPQHGILHPMAGPIRSCPSCGYSLAGLPVSQTTCPECGADVPAAAAEAARRKRDWRDLVAVSAALILLVAASSSAGYALDRRGNTGTMSLP